jgi:hypothetical protein
VSQNSNQRFAAGQQPFEWSSCFACKGSGASLLISTNWKRPSLLATGVFHRAVRALSWALPNTARAYLLLQAARLSARARNNLTSF